MEVTCPWFFQMQMLISEHSNTIPMGLGNSHIEINMDGDELDHWDMEQEDAELPSVAVHTFIYKTTGLR